MRPADIRLVIGTRPEAIKLEPLARALDAQGLTPSLVFTGQHPQLYAAEFGLGGFDATHLDCAGQQDPHRHAADVAERLQASSDTRADLIVVQGDTSSAYGGALAASHANVPLAHVEAGLRTHDVRSPWPEEEYRVAIDRMAKLLFAPTEVSAANLRSENLTGDIYVTGNTGIDAVLAAERRLPPLRLREPSVPVLLVTCHRRESWGEGLGAIAAALLELAAGGACVIDMVLHPNSSVQSRIQELLSGADGVRLLQPCGHLQLLERMRDADLVLSDSGGIQEEAPTLGVPLLVLREKTERPEGVTSGNARLVGTSTERIVAETASLLADPIRRGAMSRRAFPYGDGKAGPRIAALISQWLERTSAPVSASI